jgi:hypothetical protein
MNSKQLNFYITDQDKIAINDFFKEKKCVLLKDNIADLHSMFLESMLQQKGILKAYLSTEEYVNKVEYSYLESKEYHYFNIVKSLAIELDFGGFYPYSNKELHRGRLYYILKYYSESSGELVKKEDGFIAWADDIFKSFKKKFLKQSPAYSGMFFSEQCLDWINKSGAKLAGGGMKFIVD